MVLLNFFLAEKNRAGLQCRKTAMPLTPISKTEKFRFSCGTGNPCFNRCCSGLELPITPYDALRLCAALGIGSRDLLGNFLALEIMPETGLPLAELKMLPEPGEPCPFVTPAGCRVYPDRPGACRVYPLGRASKTGLGGIEERFYLIREEHCKGFDNGDSQTPSSWAASQKLEEYNRFNDLYMRLGSMLAASGKPLPESLRDMAALCLYRLDDFKDFIIKMELLRQLHAQEDVAGQILSADRGGLEARLEFGFALLESCIFGRTQN